MIDLARYNSEPLDQCFERNLITKDQHEAGMKMRKLHDALFGVATVKAYNMAKVAGRSCCKTDEFRLQMQHREYLHLVRMLSKEKVWGILADVCIYQLPASFLSYSDDYEKRNKDLEVLRNGLEMLCDYFTKKRRIVKPLIKKRFKKMDRLIETLRLDAF